VAGWSLPGLDSLITFSEAPWGGRPPNLKQNMTFSQTKENECIGGKDRYGIVAIGGLIALAALAGMGSRVRGLG
jgi:hypothetical protein